MNIKYHIGIDISKETFDYSILNKKGKEMEYGEIKNDRESILKWITSLGSFLDWNETLVCMEHSGYYGYHLLRMIDEYTESSIWLENAVQIKRSMGLQRGKDDRTDALRIGLYSIDFQRKMTVWEPSSSNIEKLNLLISHRDRMVRNRKSTSVGLNEQKGFVEEDLHLELEAVTADVLREMDRAISKLDKKISELISNDVSLARQYEIIESIPGFGKVISSKIIEVTKGFTRLNNPKSFACYAGVAPFRHSSGTSVKGKTRVSHLANKEIKKMLHLAALVTIRKGGIMRSYFDRKVAEGKNKMTVINAVRNKLIHILMACIRKDVTYLKNYQQ